MNEGSVEEYWGEEAPDLSSLFDLPGILPAKSVECFGIRCQEFSVCNFVEPEGNEVHDYVDNYNKNRKCAASKRRTQVHLDCIVECFIACTFIAGVGFFIPLKEAAEEATFFFHAHFACVAFHISSPLFLLSTSLFITNTTLFC